MVTIRASVTPCFLSCVNNSSLVVFLSSGVLRTPFEVFSVLCGDTFTGTWANSVTARSLVECVSLSTSIRRSPERSLLMVLGSPTKPWIPFGWQMLRVWREISHHLQTSSSKISENIILLLEFPPWSFYTFQGKLGHYHNLHRYFSALSLCYDRYPWCVVLFFHHPGSPPTTEPYKGANCPR